MATNRLLATLAALSLAGSGCSIVLPHSNGGIAFFETAPGPVGPAATGAKYAGWAAGAPAVAALVPLGALAWATPWVDLPLATDIVTAPSIGLGYALEAAVGAPLYAAFFWMDDRAEGAEDGDPRLPVPWGFIARHLPATRPARPAAPLPAAILERYAVPAGAAERLGAAIERAAAGVAAGEPISIPVEVGIASSLELTLAEGGGPRPLVLMTPPSEGAFAARWLARRYARRGVHAAVIVPEEATFLDPRLDAAGIERKLRAAVVGARVVAAALARRADVAGGRVLYLGISAGGIFGAVLLAVEPLVARGALIFPGGDMPALIAASEEDSVRAYREAWTRRGVGPAALSAAFAAAVRTDPLLLAPHVDPARALLFLSDDDTAVPIAGGEALRRAMGEPETYVLAGDHETAGLCFGFVLRRADAFLLDED